MKTRLVPLAASLAILGCLIAAPPEGGGPEIKEEAAGKIAEALASVEKARPEKARKLLVFSKTNGFRHGSIPVGVRSMMALGEKSGAFSVVHSEDESMFEKETLSQFDAVLMLNTTGEVFRPKDLPGDEAEKAAALEREERLKKNLVEFVRSGRGLAGFHSATDTYKQWKDYNDMMGGAFAGHPWHEKVPLKNLAPDSPLNRAFEGADLEITDEIYQFRNDTAAPSDRKMLLSLDPGRMDLKKGARDDGFYPVSWLDAYGDGRVFYCSLGHRDEIFWNPVIVRHYLDGLRYALGDLEADATPGPVAFVRDEQGGLVATTTAR